MRLKIFLLLVLLGLSAFFPAAAGAHPATGIVVDTQGRIYFSDLETIWRLDAEGRLTVFRAGGRGRHVHELSIDGEGRIYGAEETYEPRTKRWISSVWRMTPDGRETYIVEQTHEPPRGASVWRDHAGNTYFVEQNNHTKRETLLLRRSPDGRVETLAGGAYGHADGRGAEAKFGSVGGLTIGADGSLYLTDNGSLRRVATDGTVRTLATGLDAKSLDDVTVSKRTHGSLMGVAVDKAGNAYVADHGNRRVLRVTPEGKVERILSAEPPWSPTGVATDGDGGILVLEIGFTVPATFSGPRVRRLSADGKVKTLATVGAKEKTASRMTFQESAGAASEGASDATREPAAKTAARYEKNISKLDGGLAAYFGLGLLAISVCAGLRSSRRKPDREGRRR